MPAVRAFPRGRVQAAPGDRTMKLHDLPCAACGGTGLIFTDCPDCLPRDPLRDKEKDQGAPEFCEKHSNGYCRYCEGTGYETENGDAADG